MKVKKLLVCLLFLVMALSGWPPIWQNSRIPLNIKIAEAAFTARTETTANSSSQSSPYSLSVNTPTDVVNGDIMFLWAGLNASTIDSIDASWLSLGSYTANNDKYYLYYKVASNEPSSYTVSAAASGRIRLVMTAYSAGDWNGADPIDVVSNTAYRTSNSVARAASINIGAANSPLMYFGALYNTSTNSWTKPADIGGDVWVDDYDNRNATSDFSLQIASMMRTSSGATGNIDATNSLSSQTTKHAFAVALKPAPNNPPSLTVSQPDGTSDTVTVGQSYNITYDLSDTEDTATVDFYYDANGSGTDGTVIAGCQDQVEGTGATCSWDTTGMTPGDYYIYGIATDGVNPNVNDYSPGVVTINAAPVVSITVTSDGTISYGLVALNGSKNTTSSDLNDTQTAQNDGNATENFNIKTSNATGGTQWTLGATPGADVFVHEFSTNGGTNWTKFITADSYQSLVTGITTNGTQGFDLKITAPSTSSDYQQKTITVTVQAVTP